ncbi:hypothetical protein ACWDQ0_35270 [Streptomyces sp. NPDC003642]
MMCTACPNARIHPGHHQRLAHLYHALTGLRDVMDAADWQETWGEAHARLENLKDRLGDALWQRAVQGVTPADREMINLLLDGDLDA